MKIDLHVHTSRHSPCSKMRPDEMMERAKAEGLDGVCLTEHQIVWDKTEAEELARRHGLAVFRGVEVTTTAGDVLVFGLEQSVQGILTPEEIRWKTDETGGLCILAHPFRGFLVFGFSELSMGVEEAAAMPVMGQVHGLEVCNTRVTLPENEMAAKVADHLGLMKFGGSDAHAVGEVGVCVTILEERAENEADLIRLLKSGKFGLERRR